MTAAPSPWLCPACARPWTGDLRCWNCDAGPRPQTAPSAAAGPARGMSEVPNRLRQLVEGGGIRRRGLAAGPATFAAAFELAARPGQVAP